MTAPRTDCPLCRTAAPLFYGTPPRERRFRLCPRCRYLFQENLPSEQEQRDRYSLHRNSAEEKGYVDWLERFLRRGFLPWDRGGAILDFGSGPEPVLSGLLRERGREVRSYDKFFAPAWPGEEHFDCILLSEVLEHLEDPVAEWNRIASVAAPGARIILQSALIRSFRPEWFAQWWYKEDITHIGFFCASSLLALGEAGGWDLLYQDGRSLGVFKKRPGG